MILLNEKVYSFYLLLLILLTLLSCTALSPTPEPGYDTEFIGTIYNACDGTCACSGKTLDFYIDYILIATIMSGCNSTTVVTPEEHTFTVLETETQDLLEFFTLYILPFDWSWWYGCEDGTHPYSNLY